MINRTALALALPAPSTEVEPASTAVPGAPAFADLLGTASVKNAAANVEIMTPANQPAVAPVLPAAPTLPTVVAASPEPHTLAAFGLMPVAESADTIPNLQSPLSARVPLQMLPQSASAATVSAVASGRAPVAPGPAAASALMTPRAASPEDNLGRGKADGAGQPAQEISDAAPTTIGAAATQIADTPLATVTLGEEELPTTEPAPAQQLTVVSLAARAAVRPGPKRAGEPAAHEAERKSDGSEGDLVERDSVAQLIATPMPTAPVPTPAEARGAEPSDVETPIAQSQPTAAPAEPPMPRTVVTSPLEPLPGSVATSLVQVDHVAVVDTSATVEVSPTLDFANEPAAHVANGSPMRIDAATTNPPRLDRIAPDAAFTVPFQPSQAPAPGPTAAEAVQRLATDRSDLAGDAAPLGFATQGAAPAAAPSAGVTPASQPLKLDELLVGSGEDAAWLDRLADDIKLLADGDRREAQVRLSPRALGDMGVRLELEGRAARVHFTVETAAAQGMIADNSSRLVQLVEANGLKLDGATVDLGSRRDDREGAPQPQPAPEFQRAPRASATLIEAVARTRVATAAERFA